MNRDHVISVLQSHRPELQRAGVAHLSVFGSVARNEARPDSDVDLLAKFDKTLSILDVVAIENRLSDLLGARVELSQERMLKDIVRDNASQEAVLAF